MKIVFFFLTFYFFVQGHAAPPPIGKWLNCRGGGTHIFAVEAPNRALVSFDHSNLPSGQGLNEGECSFADRGLTINDPIVICRSVTKFVFGVWLSRNSISEWHFDQGEADASFRKFLDPNSYFRFYVQNNGNACFEIPVVIPKE